MAHGVPANPWTRDQIKRLREMRDGGADAEEMAERLGRTPKSVREKLVRMSRPRGRHSFWSKEELAQLINLRDVQRKTFEEVAIIMEKSISSVHSKHQYLKRPFKAPQPAYALIIPSESEQDRQRRQSLRPRDLTAHFMGDPLPGYSALEQRT